MKQKLIFPKEEWDDISDEAKDLISKMLVRDPKKRLTADKCIRHPFVKKFSGKVRIDRKKAKLVLNNLKSFRVKQKLQHATWIFMVSYLATKEEKKELLKVFQALDTNKDGQLSKKELENGFSKIFGDPKADASVKEIMACVDIDDNGSIDYSEFVTACISRTALLSEKRLRQAFKIMDKDNSGGIEIAELKNAFRMHNVDDQVWKTMMKQVDDNSDGEIQFDEFLEMMQKTFDT